jgi:RNA 2',3'-cyclic 3'-phosphodiesterase
MLIDYYPGLREMTLTHSPDEIRAFIAIELPEEVRRALARLRSDLEKEEHWFVKWVDVEGIHLTLKFLGNIHSKQVAEITRALGEATKGNSPFSLEISNLGAFPNLKQPRVFWVGIRGDVERLLELHQSVDFALSSLGFTLEERPFTPHLTLARVKQLASPEQRRSFGELVVSSSFKGNHIAHVHSILLMRSQLTPAGAIYSCLAEAKLPSERC